MPVELRKRPAPKEDPAPAAKRSASKPRATTSKAKQVVEKAKALVTGEPATTKPTPAVPTSDTVGDSGKVPETVGAGTAGTEPAATTATAAPSTTKAETPALAPASTTAAPSTSTSTEATTPLSSTSINQTLPASALSTPTLTHNGTQATLATLLSTAPNGAIIFTYPKASTPGCTTQACLFRDNHDALRAQGYAVYGLSTDSEKANAGFRTKQNLPYDMLCDPDARVTAALGMKKPGPGKGTVRGVVVLSRDAVVKVWFQGGPAKTLDAVKEFLG